MMDRARGATEGPIRLRCAFLGDSIAVFAKRKAKSEPWQVITLTDIHRPDREDEKKRILAAGGKLHQSSEPDASARLLTPDCYLAMSRSFGDFHAVPFGLSSEPEFWAGELTADHDSFVLVASDGVWDVISPAQA